MTALYHFHAHEHEADLTVRQPLKSRITSQWGNLSWQEWCQKECQRLNQKGRKFKVQEEAGLVWITKV